MDSDKLEQDRSNAMRELISACGGKPHGIVAGPKFMDSEGHLCVHSWVVDDYGRALGCLFEIASPEGLEIHRTVYDTPRTGYPDQYPEPLEAKLDHSQLH